MDQAVFNIQLSAEKVLMFYQAKKNRVIVTAEDGRSLSVPWELLRPYITQTGIDGRFLIKFDAKRKATALIQLR